MPLLRSNRQILKDAVTTATVTSGLLNDGQASRFLRQTFDATPLMGAIRHEMRREKKGEIDKIGVGKRLLRRKVENVDDGYRAEPLYGSIQYSCNPVRLPWEVTEETLRENIEGENLDRIITDLFTKQIGVDTEDLIINGDEATLPSDPDYDFLKLDDGIIKQIKNNGHIYDATGATDMDLEMFYKTISMVPNKYNNGNLRWLMSPTRAQQWELFLLQKVINAGGAVPESLYQSPAAIKALQVPALANDVIILADPKNIIEVNTYTVKVRKDATSKDAIYQDKRFYVVHFDLDTLIEEPDATAIITNLPAYTFS